MSTVTGIFRTRAEAEEAITRLETGGISESQIGMVMTDLARGSHFRMEESSKADEGAAAGAGIGGLVGVVLGSVLSAGTIAIPGLNLVVVGALAPALAGLGAGAVAGGLIGGLIGAGIPEHEAKMYEKEIKRGNVLLAVTAKTSEQTRFVKDVFRDLHAGEAAA
jgi:hypothetical protein